jgi:uncharacterized damage-inducible protein DinB
MRSPEPSDLLRRLFDHLRWADRRALEALRRAAGPPAQAVEIYAHVLGAEQIWLDRLRGEPAAAAVWPRATLDECAELAARSHAGYAALLDGLGAGGLDREVDYVNSAGQPFRSRVSDILLHVALHGSYHRGQVALLMRQAGAVPEPTDYIAFVRGVPAATREDR